MMIILVAVAAIGVPSPEIKEVRRLSYENSDHRILLRQLASKPGLFFQSKMSCDVDGAPNAYHPTNDDLALDVIGSAEGKRVGDGTSGPLEELPNPEIVVYQNGQPYVQVGGNYAGFYVSETSLYDPTRSRTDSARYLDSRSIQYVVLPAGLCPEAKLGDVAVIYDPETKKVAYAVYGDIGPASESGEASLATLLRLGLNTPDGKSSPAEYRDDLFYLVFPGTSDKLKNAENWPHTQDVIDRLGASEFSAWGGIGQVEAILSQQSSCGSIKDTPQTEWIYNELAFAKRNGWIRTVKIGLPTRLAGQPSRLPCAPEIVLACQDAISGIQKRIEAGEQGQNQNLDENLEFHLRQFVQIASRFPEAAADEGVSTSVMAVKGQVLVSRLQALLVAKS